MTKVPTQPKRPLIDKLTEGWAGVRNGHEGVMLEDARAVLAQERTRTRSGQQPSDNASGQSLADNAEDSMGDLTIGDQTVIHNYPAPTPLPPPAESKPSKLPGWLKKGAIAAALLGSGAAIPWLAGAFDKDTDTLFELRLEEPP